MDVKEMTMDQFVELQENMPESNLKASMQMVAYGTGLTLEELGAMPQQEVRAMINQANEANGFTAESAEGNLDDSPSS